MRDLKHRTLVASDNGVDKIIRTQDIQEVFLKVVGYSEETNVIVLLMDNGKEYIYFEEPVDKVDSLMNIYASNIERYMSEYVEINSHTYIEKIN